MKKAQCFAAGKEDFRCASPDGSVLLSTWFIERDEDRKQLEQYCGTITKAAANRQCVATIRFSFLEPAGVDNLGPYLKRLIRAVAFDLHF